jgi:eukaryotic-like serine/threonine-protein kinase
VRVTDRDGGIDFWIVDVSSGRRSRFTFGPDRETRGLWSPDGRQVLFSATDATGKSRLYLKPADGSGTPTVMVEREFSVHPDGWSPDGRYLLYGSPSSTQGIGNGQLWREAIDRSAAPEPFAPTPFDESQGQISPDGQWVAYASNETGRQEVYVAPLAGGSGARWQVSTGGGRLPRWRPGGGELFFLSPEGAVMAVATASDRAAFRFEAPRRLFTVPGLRDLGGTPMYAVSRDGQRILMARPVDSPRGALSVSLHVRWQASRPAAP